MSTNGQGHAGGGKSFLFDAAFPSESKQKYIFQQSIKPLVEACLKGYNATVLAYGQTGSGKTFTILGSSPDSILAEEADTGVIPRAIRDLFNRLETTRKKHQLTQNIDFQKKKGEQPFEYEVRVQFLELYGEEIRDLLNISCGTKLVIRDGGGGVEPEVIGASEVKVNSAEEALLCLTRGTLRRVTGATAMNSESSRSHAIMTVIVEQTTVVRPGSGNSVANSGSSNGSGKRSGSSVKMNGNTEIESKRSKFHFVDLAGSERQKRSQSKGQRLREGIDINKGLLVLGNVISALGDPKKRGKSFVPYRDSKLTRLLKGSLGGNHKTLMIACVSPSSANLAETLNCLRYANRAKNIQNNAIINLDSGSKLVAVLRTQVQALAGELLVVRRQSGDGCSTRFALDTLKMLAKGGDSSNLRAADGFGFKRSRSSDNLGTQINSVNGDDIETFKAKIAKLESVTKQVKEDLTNKSEELFAAKAESEYYRLQISGENGSSSSEEGKDAFVNRAQTYEREIESLRKQLRSAKAHSTQPIFQPLTPSSSPLRSILPDDADDAPTMLKSSHIKRNRAKTFKPIVITDDEEKEENEEIQKITRKYLKVGVKKGSSVEDEDDERVESKDIDEDEDEDETSMSRQSILSSHMLQLTKGIIAKQELIGKLERSQLKYEKMKLFYHGKLKQMTMQLSIQEAEKVKLETELKKNEIDSQQYKELAVKLNAKQKHIDQLKKRHTEVKALTSIASRNEAVITNLTTEIEEMKRKKTSLEHQLLKERKEHAKMLLHFQKKASTQQKKVIQMRHQLATTLAQKQKVQDIAKAHAEEITELRSKYKSAEKRLRMQTLKRGMMEKAGIDPVLIGHHGRRTTTKTAKSSYSRNDTRSHSSGDIHKMRSFLDDKIAEISRKEAAADKLAHEWEDHLDLTNRKEQFVADNGKRNDSTISDEIEALDFQIKYKESRIRQLASKLTNKSSNGNISTSRSFSHDALVGDKAFESITSDLSPLAASQLASKVLFGIVVRERRRVATLARAASTLDQKAVQAEKLAADKEAALRSLIDETKNERVAMAQNQQEKILSLMEIVQGDDQEEEIGVSAELRTSQSESVVLRLANERIETVEAQLSDLKQEKESRESYQVREAETVTELKQLTKEYSHLLDTSKTLRTSLLRIRDKISATSESHDPAILTTITQIVTKTLKSMSQAAKVDKENADRRNITSPYEDSDSEDDEDGVPEWAGHIMKDLAIIAAGEVPASLKTPREGGKQRVPRTPGGSVFDRLSSPDNFTTSHYERLSDNASVGSNTTVSRSNSRSHARSRSTSRSRYNTPSRDERSSTTPQRYHSSRSPSPMRQRQKSPRHSDTRLTDRVSAILKDGPPRVLSASNYPIDDDEQSFRSTGSRSVRSTGSRSVRSTGSRSVHSGRRQFAAESKFVKAYTKKDVFERLQKKHTNSYTLNIKSSQTLDNDKYK